MLRCTVEEVDRAAPIVRSIQLTALPLGMAEIGSTAIQMLFRPQVCVIDHARAGPDHLA
jgi:hypothetical protein